MSRSKHYQSYPDSFKELIRVGVTKRLEFDLGSPEEAKKARGRLYAFFGALEKERQKPNGEEEARTLRNQSMKIKLAIEGTKLVVYPADEEPLNRLVAEVLQHQGDAPATSGGAISPSAMLRDLAEKGGSDDDK